MKSREDASSDWGAQERALRNSAELDAELCAAVRDFETGNYIELPPGHAKRCSETGESLWPDESPV
jgi:hypothetical protein